MEKATAKTLHNLVEFDCPFRVLEGGYIERPYGIYAPEECFGHDIEDQDRRKYFYPFPGYEDTWELVSGFSGQDRYSGPVMHNSEYLGDYMAEYVLENPGVYCLMAVSWGPNCAECNDGEDQNSAHEADYEGGHTFDPEDEDYIEGWVLARYKGEA